MVALSSTTSIGVAGLFTVMVTVPVSQLPKVSQMVYSKLSSPTKPSFGVYVTVSSLISLGVPPSLITTIPLSGVVTVKVPSEGMFESLSKISIITGVFSSVVALSSTTFIVVLQALLKEASRKSKIALEFESKGVVYPCPFSPEVTFPIEFTNGGAELPSLPSLFCTKKASLNPASIVS